MLILPIGLLGSIIMLWPTGNHVSMVALLGVIILAGTVVNSSIVLIDYTLQRRQRGEDKNTAILRNIKTGMEDENNIEVLEGLRENDNLVTKGFETMKENSKVKVQK